MNDTVAPAEVNNSKLENETIESKDESPNPEDAEKTNMDVDNQLDIDKSKTIAASRPTRSKNTISYNESSEDEESSVEYNPLFNGLSKEEIEKIKKQDVEIQNGYKQNLISERLKKLEEIKNGFKFNIETDITDEEASFIFDFCQKYQLNVLQKIEDEGIFFLDSIREMIIEKKHQENNSKERKKRLKNKKKKNNNDDSEYSENSDEYCSDDFDSDFSCDEEDNYNLISEEDDDDDDYLAWGDKKKKKRYYKRKASGEARKGYNIDGSERCGRLLLDDALKDTTNFEGWSIARIEAYKNRKDRPNAYYYRFNEPGEKQKNGGITKAEHKTFMERVKQYGVNVNWGLFSKPIEGRVGYQCSNYWRQMVKEGLVEDPNYDISADGKLTFKRKQNNGKAITESFRRYSFVVLKDVSKVFKDGETHPKCPKNINKLLKQVGKKPRDDSIIDDEDDDEKEVVEKKSKKNKKKKSNTDDSTNDSEKENKKSKKKKKKRKNKESEQNKDEQPPKKKRKKSPEKTDETENKQEKKKEKNKKKKRNKKEEKQEKKGILADFIDVMTGEKVIKPAISPYGHVLGYDSWCKILRSKKSKDTCPFTKQKLTRRSLVKLDETNFEEYKNKIINVKSTDLL